MRIQWIDIAKGIAILLVCVGHTRLGLEGAVASWITSFHMPLFFVLAGLCFDERRYKTLGEYVLRKCRALAYPYFALSFFVAFFLAIFTFGSEENWVRSLLVDAFPGRKVIGFWFVRVLFFVEICYAVLARVPFWWRMALIGLLGVAGFYMPQGHDLLRVNTICISLMFYEIGCLCRPLATRSCDSKTQIGIVLVGLLIQVIALGGAHFPVSGFGVSSFQQNGGLVVVVAVLGTLVVSVSAQVLERIPMFGTGLAWLGRNSLALLALHPNAGICRSQWVMRWPVLTGWKSIVLELFLISFFMWALAGPLKMFLKFPQWTWPRKNDKDE